MIFLVTSILKPLPMVKSCPIFDQAAKLGKASMDAYNAGLLLILKDLLKNWVAKVTLPTLMTLQLTVQLNTRQIQIFFRFSKVIGQFV